MSSSRSTVLTEDSVADLGERFGSSLSIQEEWIQVPRQAFSSSEDNEVIAIPRELNSVATLRFLGLSKVSADQTWNRYSKFLETEDDDVISFALGTVRGGQDTDSIDDEDWIVAMRTMGARKVLRNRIMTSGFDFIRLTKTPKTWVLQTFKERWSELKSLDNILLGRQGQIATEFISLKERKANKGKEVEGKGSSSKAGDDEAGEDKRLAIENVVQDRFVKVDEVELFKGGGYERMLKAFIPENIPGPRYDTRALGSTAPTDFSRSSDDTYWARNLELPEHFAAYHQARNATDIRTGMLHIIIPKAIVELAIQFKETKHWQEFVWLNSIRGEIPGYLAYLERAQVLIGPMLGETHEQVLRKHNAGKDFSILRAKKLASGQSATQIACKGKEIHNQLNAVGRMWLEEWIHPTALQKKGADTSTAVAFFYFDYEDSATQDLSNILGSLAQQFGKQDEESFEKLREFYEIHNPGHHLDFKYDSDSLWSLVRAVTLVFDCAMIIVDGLDECGTNAPLVVDSLIALNNDENTSIKTIFLSRDEIEIRERLEHYTKLSIAARSSDLRLYVAAEIDLRIRHKRLRIKDQSLKEHILERL